MDWCHLHSVWGYVVSCDEPNSKPHVLEGVELLEVAHHYPLEMTNMAIENGHGNSQFSHKEYWKWWILVDLSIFM